MKIATDVRLRCERYLSDMAREGRDLDEWIRTFDPNYFPGVTRGELRAVLGEMTRRGWVPEARPLPSPQGLYGARK